MKRVFLAVLTLIAVAPGPVRAQRSDPGNQTSGMHLPADVTTRQALALQGRELAFTATAGSIRLKNTEDAPLTDLAFIAYQAEAADVTTRPVTFVFNGGPGMASAWLQMGAVGPWRVRINPVADGPSASAVPVPNDNTWLDFTDLVFIDPPGTGYSGNAAPDAGSSRALWSVGGDIDALAQAIRRWLDHSGRNASPKYILGESYGGFRGPRLARELRSEEGVGISGLILLSPLLDVHVMSGYADPLAWVDLLPSEVAISRARHGSVARSGLADVEAYAAGDYLVDILRGSRDTAALDRLTARVAGLTGLDTGIVRPLGGRLDRSWFQRNVAPARVSSAYDGTVSRPSPDPRVQTAQFPDPVLSGLEAPVTTAMLLVYAEKLNWHPDKTYHLSNNQVFSAWNWGHGMGRPESFTALQAARSVDPNLRVLIGHGMFDLVTPYFATARMLRLLPSMPGAAPIVLRVYQGGHMFYFNDQARAALHDDAKAVFDPSNASGESR